MADREPSAASAPGPAAEAEPGAARLRMLAIDDQAEVLILLRRMLGPRGFDVVTHTDPRAALAEVEARADDYDLVSLDLGMPLMKGQEFLIRARTAAPDLPIVVVTGDRSAESAVGALKAGAFDYVTKPFDDLEAVLLAFRRAAAYGQLQRRNHYLEQELRSRDSPLVVGGTPAMRRLFTQIEQVARTDVSVLIRGESGTGKELVARAIHERSERGPFVAMSCAALPDSLIDSELFGYSRGAFTGATSDHPGLFAQAHGGTLLLDEIGDIPLAVQLRLLRVLQEREVRPLGATAVRSVNVRVIAATHVDLEAAATRGTFRSDLFFRLSVVTLTLPPLRERLEDVPLLVRHLLEKHAKRQGRPVPRLSPATLEAMTAYPWPGNVRELENAVQHALALGAEDIDVSALPDRVLKGAAGVGPLPTLDDGGEDLPYSDATRRARQQFERSYLERVLARADGNISQAARLAHLDRANFRRLLARHGLGGR